MVNTSQLCSLDYSYAFGSFSAVLGLLISKLGIFSSLSLHLLGKLHKVLSRFYRVNVYGGEIIQRNPEYPLISITLSPCWKSFNLSSCSWRSVPSTFLELCSGFLVYHLRPSLLIDMATLTCIDVPPWWTVPSLEVFAAVLHLKLQGFCTLFTSWGGGALGGQESRYQPYFCSLSGVPTIGLPSVLFLSSPSPGSMSHQGLFLVCSCQALTDVPCCAISSGLIEAITLKHSLASLLEPR